MAELDRFDRLILEALQHNARLSGAELARRVKPGGHLVLSGILAQHADAVQMAFAHDFAFGPLQQREDWVLLDGVRRSP